MPDLLHVIHNADPIKGRSHPLTLLPVGYTDQSSLGTLAVSSLMGDCVAERGNCSTSFAATERSSMGYAQDAEFRAISPSCPIEPWRSEAGLSRPFAVIHLVPSGR
jgi:hypothetical protein